MKIRQNVYDLYWYLAAQRQKIFFKKLKGENQPYTNDPILNEFKFCNTYRASDRASQFLIKDVIYSKEVDKQDALFRIFLFRLLNKTETWQWLEDKLGGISLKNFSFEKYDQAINDLYQTGNAVYGNAFILCANKVFGFDKKHQNHLALLERVFLKDRLDSNFLNTKSLKQLFERLRELPLIGDFMAYQLAIDFNYSEVFNFDENDFTVAGPGAKRGIRKAFISTDQSEAEVIFNMAANQGKEFKRLGIKFEDLWGRPMHAIDCQGMFCELDKYCRIKLPELKSNRVKVKTRYKASNKPLDYFYPPKWGINDKIYP